MIEFLIEQIHFPNYGHKVGEFLSHAILALYSSVILLPLEISILKTIMNYLVNLKKVLLFSSLFFSQGIFSQDTKSGYLTSINEYLRKYVATHEVVKGEDRKHLHFFPPDSNYRVTATFKKIDDKTGDRFVCPAHSSDRAIRY